MAIRFDNRENSIEEMRKRKVISQNERIMGIVDATEIVLKGKSARGGMLICSDKRVIMYTSKIFGRWEARNVPLDHISYVYFKQGFFTGELTINTSSGEQILFIINKKDGPIIQQIISNQTIILKATSTGTTIPSPDPLLELQLMYATGEISEETYLRRMTII